MGPVGCPRVLSEAACGKWDELVLDRAAEWDQLVLRELIPEAACEKWVQLVLYQQLIGTSWLNES